jgi:hypothetical protein
LACTYGVDGIFEDDFDDSLVIDSSEEEEVRKQRKKKVLADKRKQTKEERELLKKLPFDPDYLAELAETNPDDYWKPYDEGEPISFISNKQPLSLKQTLTHHGTK